MNDVLSIRDLSFSYPDGRHALDSVSFSVGAGECVGIVGPNGAGKSTLLLHLNGILRAGDGAVKVLGQSVVSVNLKWVRSKVGLVFQDPDDQLFSPTVFEDVAFGPINMGCEEQDVNESVARALEEVGMAGFEKRSSHHLSFGERKRISLATVLAMEPEILVLDEPTSGLDPAGRWSLIELLRGLPVTKIVASHDMDLVGALCDRVIILHSGRVVADGPAEEVLGDRKLLAAHGLLPHVLDEAARQL